MEKIWLENYDYFVPESIRYPKTPLYQILEYTCLKYEDVVATIFFDQKMTYGELRDKVRRFATALKEMGVRKGDRVAMILPNCPQMIISYYGILESGGVATAINPLNSEREIEFQLKDSGAEVLIYLDLFNDKVESVLESTPVTKRIATSISDYMETPGEVAVAEGPNVFHFRNVVDESSPEAPDLEIDVTQDLAALQYTGGTTGISKGVMLTHRNLLANVLQIHFWAKEFIERGKDVFMCILPFFHSYGQTVAMNTAIFSAATMILMPQFEINMMLEAIKKYQPNFFPAVPTIYVAILSHPDATKYGIDKIKLCNSGAAPLPVEIIRQFSKISGGIFSEGYGLSESSPVTHSNPILGMKKVGSIGIPFPDTEIKIVDAETGMTELGLDEPGELCIKGPQVMKGYWNNPEETANTLRDGWLYTGDISKVDEDGYFYIVDRKKDMIIAGGFNIYPRDIDEVLFEHPKVQEAIAVGVPDEYRGETVKAFVVLKEGQDCTEDEIISFCKERLAKYKVPKLVEFRVELPKSLIGKVLRRALLEEEIEKRKAESED